MGNGCLWAQKSSECTAAAHRICLVIEGYILLIILVGDTHGSEHIWNLISHILGYVKDTYMELEIQLANVVDNFFSQQAWVKLLQPMTYIKSKDLVLFKWRNLKRK